MVDMDRGSSVYQFFPLQGFLHFLNRGVAVDRMLTANNDLLFGFNWTILVK